MYWFSNFLTVVFKKQEISQQVVTRMQDLASEFSKIFRVDTPDPHSWRGRPPLAPNTQSGLWLGALRCWGWDPNLGPLQLFSRGCAPTFIIIIIIVPLIWLRHTLNLQAYNTCIRIQIQRTACLAGQQQHKVNALFCLEQT